MAAATDILLDDNGDLPIEDNNFTIGYSDQQHVKDCLVSFPGEWKQNPQNGVGISAYYKSRVDELKVLQKIRQQLGSDGYVLRNPKVSLVNGEMQVTPNATRP